MIWDKNIETVAADILAIDCVYYEGVYEGIKKHLNTHRDKNLKAYVVFNYYQPSYGR